VCAFHFPIEKAADLIVKIKHTLEDNAIQTVNQQVGKDERNALIAKQDECSGVRAGLLPQCAVKAVKRDQFY